MIEANLKLRPSQAPIEGRGYVPIWHSSIASALELGYGDRRRYDSYFCSPIVDLEKGGFQYLSLIIFWSLSEEANSHRKRFLM